MPDPACAAPLASTGERPRLRSPTVTGFPWQTGLLLCLAGMWHRAFESPPKGNPAGIAVAVRREMSEAVAFTASAGSATRPLGCRYALAVAVYGLVG